MSYNIDTINVLHLSAKIRSVDASRLRRKYKADLPEGCFLHNGLAKEDSDGFCALTEFEWVGEGSGNSWRDLIGEIASKIVGKVEAILTWEGGDSVTGLRIVDGKLTEPAVSMTLEREPDDLGAHAG